MSDFINGRPLGLGKPLIYYTGGEWRVSFQFCPVALGESAAAWCAERNSP